MIQRFKLWLQLQPMRGYNPFFSPSRYLYEQLLKVRKTVQAARRAELEANKPSEPKD